MKVFISEFGSSILQLIGFCLIPFIWWLIAGRKKEKFFPWIGLKKPKCETKVWKVVTIIVAVAAIYIVLTSMSIKFMPEGVTTAGSQFAGMGIFGIFAGIVYSFIRTALSEEIFFRGFLLKRVSSRWGFFVGNTVQALIFGLFHGVPFGLATGKIGVTVLLTLLPGAIGWFEGWLSEKKFGGSIIPGWLLHGTVNLIATLTAL